MKFIIGGRVIELNQLGDQIDRAFIALHAAYFGGGALDWQEFENASIQFFDLNPKSSTSHDAYFNNFTIIWKSFLAPRNYDEAEQIWRLALSPVLKWEASNQGRRAHKGTAYYLWGMTSLERGDLDRGYTLMHQAVEEDVLTQQQQIPDSPAFALASLNYAKADQAYRQWVLLQANFLSSLQNKYSATYSRIFSLDEFKNRFLVKPPSIDIVFLLAYSVARLMRLSQLPQHSIRSRFSGQLELNILFDITLIIDAAVKTKNSTKRYFIDHAKFLLLKASQPLSIKQLRQINSDFGNNFDATIKDLLDGVYSRPTVPTLNKFQSDVALAYGLRNHGAHDVSSSPVVWQRFLDIQQAVFNVMFGAVDYLY